jgi:hypothetical protein
MIWVFWLDVKFAIRLGKGGREVFTVCHLSSTYILLFSNIFCNIALYVIGNSTRDIAD